MSTLGKVEGNSAPPKPNRMTNHYLENIVMMRDTPAKQQNRISKHPSKRLLPGRENLRSNKAKKQGKQILINNVNKLKNKKLFGLVIGGNKRNTQPIENSDSMAIFLHQHNQWGHSTKAKRD